MKASRDVSCSVGVRRARRVSGAAPLSVSHNTGATIRRQAMRDASGLTTLARPDWTRFSTEARTASGRSMSPWPRHRPINAPRVGRPPPSAANNTAKRGSSSTRPMVSNRSMSKDVSPALRRANRGVGDSSVVQRSRAAAQALALGRDPPNRRASSASYSARKGQSVRRAA